MRKVVFVNRKPSVGQFSIERVFETLFRAFPFDSLWYESPFTSKGVFRRVINSVHVIAHWRSITHIVGDVTYLSLLVPGNRLVVTFHDTGIYTRTSGIRKWLIGFLWYKIPIKKAAVITAVSESTRDSICKEFNVPSTRVHVIPNPLPRSFDNVKRRQPKPLGSTVELLQVGAKPNKNLVRVVEALNYVAQEHSVRLTVVGRLPDDMLLPESRRFELVSVFDLTDDELIRLYSNSDIVMFASTFEGFGMPILEAQAMGKPVVTSALEPMQSIAGDGAILVNPYSVEELADAVKKLLQQEIFFGRSG